MTQYVVIGTHAPSQCPGANATMGPVFRKLFQAAPAIAEKHGVKRIMAPMHMDPNHKIMVVLEAPSQDAILDALRDNRLGQIQDVEVYRLTPMEELFNGGGSREPLY
jgi:hypothetical protein